MGFLDHEGGAEFPYGKDDVFDALLGAIPTVKGMKVGNHDKLSGRILTKAGVSLRSWGENIPITVTEIAPGRTRVNITSTPKTGIMFGGAIDFGKNRANLEKILTATSRLLSEKEPAQVQAPPDTDTSHPAERLAKLNDLKEKGLITPEEFDKRKAEILSEI